MTQIFEQLKSINQAGVYRLFNSQEKSCYINFSSNISGALARLLSSNLFFNQYEFEVLELVTNPVNLRIRCQYFKDLYSSNAWVIINPKRVSNWKLRISTINDFRLKDASGALFKVFVQSGAYRSVTVGIFESYADMHSFLELHYARGLVTNVVYVDNELTREYRKLHEKTLDVKDY